MLKNLLIKSELIRKTLSNINEDLILTKNYGLSKFDKLTSKKEIQKDINKFNINKKKNRLKK